MTRFVSRGSTYALPAVLAIACCALVAQNQSTSQKLDPAFLASAPTVPQMVVDSDGTLHFGPRTVPLPALASPEARKAYVREMLRRARISAERGGLASVRTSDSAPAPPAEGASKERALKIYPVVEEARKIGGVGVTIYSPKEIPAKNRHKVAMEFEMDAEAIAVASLGQFKVIKVNYRGGGPSIPGNEDIVAVYRELLKTYEPKSIGMFGASGGCTLAQTTILWLPVQKLPLPGAVGLGTCSGGSNPGDTRYTNNGLDAALSSAFSGRRPSADAPALRESQPIRRPPRSMATSPKATRLLFCSPALAICASANRCCCTGSCLTRASRRTSTCSRGCGTSSGTTPSCPSHARP